MNEVFDAPRGAPCGLNASTEERENMVLNASTSLHAQLLRRDSLGRRAGPVCSLPQPQRDHNEPARSELLLN